MLSSKAMILLYVKGSKGYIHSTKPTKNLSTFSSAGESLNSMFFIPYFSRNDCPVSDEENWLVVPEDIVFIFFVLVCEPDLDSSRRNFNCKKGKNAYSKSELQAKPNSYDWSGWLVSKGLFMLVSNADWVTARVRC